MEPYVAMMDFRIFIGHAFLELSMEAQSRFVQLIGTCDRFGVANLYQIWNSNRIKTGVMSSLYDSQLVWPADAFYCFIPSVYYANQKIRSGKYKVNFDVKGFQVCVDRYPQIISVMPENEKELVRSHGIILPGSAQSVIDMNCSENVKTEYLSESSCISAGDQIIELNGEWIDRKDHSKYLYLKEILKDVNRKNNGIVLTEEECADWFMNVYHNNYTRDGVRINDLGSLFLHYCDKVAYNKRIQGTLSMDPERQTL